MIKNPEGIFKKYKVGNSYSDCVYCIIHYKK